MKSGNRGVFVGGVCIVFINQSEQFKSAPVSRAECLRLQIDKQVFEIASRSTTRSSSTRRKNTDGKNAQSSNKDTQYGKKDAEAINIDVQQSIPSSGPFMNDAEQCTPANTEALKSKMESRSTEQESLIGYVQNLSPLKRNRKNTLDYASMTLQTASGNREVLLYSPPKRSLLLESEKSRRPIKVSCLTSTPDRKKLIINDMTKVSFPDSSEYSFQFEDVHLATPDPMTILQVLNESDEWNLVTVKGKVLTVKDPVIVGERKLKLAEAHLQMQVEVLAWIFGKR